MNHKRKSALFDRLIKAIKGKFSNEELYELLRDSCGMNNAEIRDAGVGFTDGRRQIEAAPADAIPDILAEFKIPAVPCKLKDLLKNPLPDGTYLAHALYDIGLVPVGRDCIENMTPEEQENWADIMDADVRRIFSGAHGIHCEVCGVEAERLTEFSYIIGFGAIDRPRAPRGIYAITSNAQTSYYKTKNFGSFMELLSLLWEVHTEKGSVPFLHKGGVERLTLYAKRPLSFSRNEETRLFQPIDPDIYAKLLKDFSDIETTDRQVVLNYDNNQLFFSEWEQAEPVTICGPLDGIISAYSNALRQKGNALTYISEELFDAGIERICEIGPLKSRQDSEQHLGMDLHL